MGKQSFSRAPKMNTRWLVGLFCFILVLSLLTPEVEGWGVNGRAVVAGKQKKGSPKKVGLKGAGKRRARTRKINKKRNKKSWEETPPADADVVYDDYEAAASADPGAVEAAGAAGDLAGVCEVLMFDRGEGTYSLKFVQNKC